MAAGAASPAGEEGPGYARDPLLGDAPEEFAEWFARAGAGGKVSGAEAVAFFRRSRLPKPVLAKVWSAVDAKKRGLLELPQFVSAMWLIALVQEGAAPERASLDRLEEMGRPLPQLVGINCKGELLAEDSPAKKGGGGGGGGGGIFGARTPKSMLPAQPKAKMDVRAVASIADGLKQLYFKYVRPLEEAYSFPMFHTPLLQEQDFDAKPMVLLLGQYSTGKTTFAEYLLGSQYPSSMIGPEPTTDRFVAVMHSHDERVIPGNTLSVQKDKAYSNLSRFGGAFLNKFAGAEMSSELLEYVDLVDTPGVLSGDKQRVDRQYDFPGVVRWFAERADMILVLFDPHKLDISDEFKRTIHAMHGFDDKIRCVLNKADQVDTQHLMRVYGALMWSLARVFKTPEVPRVYTGNFRDGEYAVKANARLLDLEREQLMTDLKDIPRTAVGRKVNEFVRRVRCAKIHCLIMSELKDRMPSLVGQRAKQDKLVARLEETFVKVQQAHSLAVGDFPPIEPFREGLRQCKLESYTKLTKEKLEKLDRVLEVEVPALMRRFGNPFDGK